jgi:glucose-1-phosphate thymidylyltransferase
MTLSVSKQLLPIYDKPMIYYPLSVVLLAGIKDILIISTPENLDDYKKLLGDGSRLGVYFEYKAQDSPRGLADAFIIGEEFIGNHDVCLVLGDNVFYGLSFTYMLQEAIENLDGACIFAYPVANPQEFGVVEFDNMGKAISLEEKPEKPKSKFAVPGLYFYSNDVIKRAKQIDKSERGEIEITSINSSYLEDSRLSVVNMGRGMAWLDTGTPQGMLKASEFVEAIQTRQGLYIACIEEIAYTKGYITKKQLSKLGEELSMTDYGKYILSLSK